MTDKKKKTKQPLSETTPSVSKEETMRTKILLTSQKNEIFRHIQVFEMNPVNFQWIDEKSMHNEKRDASIIKYGKTEWFFKIDYDDIRESKGLFPTRVPWICGYSPVEDKPIKEEHSCSSFGSVLERLDKWLSYVKRYIDLPDRWEELKKYTAEVPIIEDLSNEPFSDYEAENITASLNRLFTEIRTKFNLNDRQLSFVQKNIEYLKEAAKRQGRRDWMHTAIGVIVTIAMTLALSPEKTKLLWDLLKSCFAGLLQLPAP